MEIGECVECHGSIPRGQGMHVAGKDLCSECAAKVPLAEVLAGCSAAREAYPEIPKAAAQGSGFRDDGMPLRFVRPPHEGPLWMVGFLAVAGLVELIAAIACIETSGIAAAALALGSLFWFAAAVIVFLLRGILVSLERAFPAGKSPKS